MKKLLMFLLLVSVFMLAQAQFSGGSGSVSDPFLVSSKAELDSVRNYLTYHFRQTQDILFSGSDFEFSGDFYHEGAGWLPLGTLTGSYDGDGHTIDSLFINRPTEDWAGLLSVLEADASIKNLGLIGCSVTGKLRSGSIVGESLGTIDSVFAEGNVTVTLGGGLVGLNRGVIKDSYAAVHITTPGVTDASAGGLVQYNEGTVSGCYATGDVVSYNSTVGGLIARNDGYVNHCYATGNVGCAWGGASGGLVGENNLYISHSYATGAVSGINNTGGLVGSNLSNGVIEYCYALGSVTDVQVNFFNNTGGLVGKNEAGMIRNSYARGLVTLSPSNPGGTDHMAGFVGYNYRGVVENCYSTGRVTHNADDNLGFVALVDTNGAYSMSGNFWDFETSQQAGSAGEATGVTTTVMKTLSNFTSAGWDFDCIWMLNEEYNDGYPSFYWQMGLQEPVVATDSVNTITVNSVSVHCSVSDLGIPYPIQHGVCWNTTGEPDTSDNRTEEGPLDSTGTFSSEIADLISGQIYYVRAYAINCTGIGYGSVLSFMTLETAVNNSIPTEYALLQNYPNPFNPRTAISYQLSEDSDVYLSIFDINGRKVATLINESMQVGYHSVNWDASHVSSGIYFYRLQAGDFIDTKKMVFMK